MSEELIKISLTEFTDFLDAANFKYTILRYEGDEMSIEIQLPPNAGDMFLIDATVIGTRINME